MWTILQTYRWNKRESILLVRSDIYISRNKFSNIINNKRVWKIINKKFRYKIFLYYHRCSTLADNIPLIFSQQWCLQHFTKTFCWSDVLFSFDSEYLNNSALQHAFHVLQLIAFWIWICIFHDKDVSVWGAKPFELEQIMLLNGPVSQCCAYAKFSNNLRFMT